ncbi:hypothetical protein BV25DRAFT_1995044 [Artomyces pyxidatus]|uniref:Uncharacterized protein n=1 Tax=Artomyces pyxidatus TaxID=48021 RepID=A0ACB8SL78_9AGAM|nr:hypothetical protein BV25DRAFT_1995044 [Artomyces pyxidatus]
MASSSTSRKLSKLETKLHQAVLHSSKPLLQKDIDALAPDPPTRTAAVNFLLGSGMIKLMKDSAGQLSYRAVLKEEMDIKKGMSGEENMVLSHIQAVGNQGIWTKHLKAKTELHQTVIDRCLKSLTQKQLIKSVKGVKYPTRKIYMMAHLEPSVELTGGPWYTDNELDTEFIKLLCTACLRFIKDRVGFLLRQFYKSSSISSNNIIAQTFPKHKIDDDHPASSQPLYPISGAPSYPNAQQILNFLSKSKITETQFTEEHVEMLLNVLVLDGDVERLPAFGAALWEASAGDEEGSGSESEDEDARKSKKRKHARDTSVSSKSRKRKKDRGSDVDMSGSESDDEDDRRRRKGKKAYDKGKGKKRKRGDSGSEQDSDSDREVRKRKKKRKVEDSDDSDGEDDRSKPKLRSRSLSSKRRAASSDSDSDSASSSTVSDSKRSRSRSKAKDRKRSSSPGVATLDDSFTGGAYVYRAVKQERVALGWSQAPCGKCPVFDFCKDGGPVGPRGCEYYGDWLGKGVAELG